MAAEEVISDHGTLLVVGTGIQWGGQMTLAARDAVCRADRVLFAVTDPWGARWIRSLNPRAESLPYPRDGRPRREIYRAMTERILEALARSERVCAAFYGSPTFLVQAGHEAIAAARRAGHRARMLPGISSVECLAADLGIDLGAAGYQLFEANAFVAREPVVEPRGYLVLCQVAMIGQESAFDADPTRVQRGLHALAARLEPLYGRRHRVIVYEAALHPLSSPKIIETELHRLPELELSEVATLCIPPRETLSLRAASHVVAASAFQPQSLG